MCRKTAVSPLVQVANARLHQLRAQLTQSNNKRPSAQHSNVQSRAAIPPSLPAHLGWQSNRVSKALKVWAGDSEARIGESSSQDPELVPIKKIPAKSVSVSVRVYPDILLACLRNDVVSPARLWLIAKTLDSAGTGVLRVANLRKQITDKHNNHFICGKRRFRALLAQGEGIFWERDTHHRLWLRSYQKVAQRLNVNRLSLRPVQIPLKALTTNIFTTRAWFYASFHMGRGNTPISRDAIDKITGIDAQTQRKYESETNIRASFNYAIAEPASPQAIQEHAWQRGGGSFTFKDSKGYHGKKAKEYIAWQLPNTYEIEGQPCSRGMQKRINSALKHLLMEKGTTGTVQQPKRVRTYFSNAKTAVLSKKDIPLKYWPRRDVNRDGIWQVISNE